MPSGPITSWQIDGETEETVADFIFLGSKISVDDDWSHEIKRHLLLGRKVTRNLDNLLESRDITLLTKVCIVKSMVFPVFLYGCESWTIKKAEDFRTVVLEKTLESPLDSNEITLVNPKGNQPWIFIRRTGAEAEAPVLDVMGQLIGKDSDARKDWRQEEKGTAEDKMVGWHEFERAPEGGEGQGSLVCCM